MSSEIIEIIKNHKAQYLPKGNIELLFLEDEKFEEYEKSGMAFEIVNSLSMKRERTQIIVTRLSEKYLIEVSSNLESHNVGILKSVSNKLYTLLIQMPLFAK